MTVGGAFGPLFGTALLDFGPHAFRLSQRAKISAASRPKALDAVKARGRSDVGHKTLLDVLGPFAGRWPRRRC